MGRIFGRFFRKKKFREIFLDPKQPLQLPNRVLRSFHCVTLNFWVTEYFVIVATLKSFVAKKVDGVELSFWQKLQAEGFVPASGKHVKRNLPACGKTSWAGIGPGQGCTQRQGNQLTPFWRRAGEGV